VYRFTEKVYKNNKYVITHKIKQGETLFLIAQKYHVPPAVLSDVNLLNYQAELKKDSTIYIPIDIYNHITDPNVGKDNMHILYYKVKELDNLPSISRIIGIKQSVIQEWNELSDNAIYKGQVLMLGWIVVDKTELVDKQYPQKIDKTSKLNSKRKKSELPEGIKALLSEEEIAAAEAQAQKEIHFSDSISQEHQLFLSQSNHGMYTSDDKGTAVFFDMPGKVKGSKYYAFHNMAKRGTIMRIYNPGTNKTIYAKVLGPIPDNKKYYNAIVGISGGAKVALGVGSDRMWCELSYAP
jgi:LysM repeat protein